MNTKEDVIKFMTDNMAWIGFGNYHMAIKIVNKLDSEAMIEPSQIGQRFILTIPKSFFSKHTTEQENILIHELMHGREFVRQKIVDDYCEVIKEQEEEKFINDCAMLAQKWGGMSRK